jgi:hypothetical protein
MTKLLSDYMHVPQRRIESWDEKGTVKKHITYDMFVGALGKASSATGIYAGAIGRETATIEGKMDLITGKWEEGLRNMFASPEAQGGIKKLQDAVLNEVSGFPELTGKFGHFAGLACDRFSELLPGITNAGKSLMDNIVESIAKFVFSESVTKLQKSILDLSAAIMNLPFVKGTISFVENMSEAVAGMAGLALEGVKDGLNYVFNPDQYAKDQEERRKQLIAKVGDHPMPSDAIRIKGVDMCSINKMTEEMLNRVPELRMPQANTVKKKEQVLTAGIASKNPDLKSNKELVKYTGDAITGGGEKQVVIHIKNFAEHFNVYAQNIKDGGKEVKEVFERMFLEVLMSANAAG